MAEKTVSAGELHGHLRKMQKHYRAFEDAVAVAQALVSAEETIVVRNGELDILNKEKNRVSRDLEIERSKLAICKKDVTDRNKVITEKNKTIEKLDTYINGGFKKRENELDEEYNNLKREKDTEIREAQKLVDAKYDELNSVQTKLDAIKIELRKFKEALVV